MPYCIIHTVISVHILPVLCIKLRDITTCCQILRQQPTAVTVHISSCWHQWLLRCCLLHVLVISRVHRWKRRNIPARKLTRSRDIDREKNSLICMDVAENIRKCIFWYFQLYSSCLAGLQSGKSQVRISPRSHSALFHCVLEQDTSCFSWPRSRMGNNWGGRLWWTSILSKGSNAPSCFVLQKW
jgi:hypothetical protein